MRSPTTTVRGAILTHADLAGTSMWEADFVRAELFQANLRHAMASGVDGQHADFGHIGFTDSSFTWADLRDANLGGAVLYNASLCRADFNGASLSGASLARAADWGAKLQGVKGLQGTARSDMLPAHGRC